MDWRKENRVRSGRELTSQWWTKTCGTLAFTGPARVLKDQYRHRYHLLIRLPFSTCFLFEMMSTRYRFLNSFFSPIGFNRKLAPADANWIISCSLSSPIPPPPQKKNAHFLFVFYSGKSCSVVFNCTVEMSMPRRKWLSLSVQYWP